MTGGTNTGCMKLIGETVKQGQFLVPDGSKMRRGLKAIGLCSWGYIANSESLVNQTSTEFHKVVYNSNLEIKKFSKPPLDPNHTHFLMVDSGQNFQYMRVGFGGLTDFITEFERMVRSTTYIYIYIYNPYLRIYISTILCRCGSPSRAASASPSSRCCWREAPTPSTRCRTVSIIHIYIST